MMSLKTQQIPIGTWIALLEYYQEMNAFGLCIFSIFWQIMTLNLNIKSACRKKVLHIIKPQNVDCKTGIHNYVLTCTDLSRKQQQKPQYISYQIHSGILIGYSVLSPSPSLMFRSHSSGTLRPGSTSRPCLGNSTHTRTYDPHTITLILILVTYKENDDHSESESKGKERKVPVFPYRWERF